MKQPQNFLKQPMPRRVSVRKAQPESLSEKESLPERLFSNAPSVSVKSEDPSSHLSQPDKISEIHLQDENIAEQRPQVIAAILATFGGFPMGTVIGWFVPAESLIKEQIKPSNDDLTWIACIPTLGGLVSQILTAVLLDRVGRKKTMICALPVLILGWFLIVISNHKITYLIGRFLTGLGSGTFDVVAPVYVAEIAQKEIRGSLIVLYQLELTLGLLYAYMSGLSLDITILSFICCIPTIIFAIIIYFLPESPAFLLYKNKNEDAAKSLQSLRGKNYDITEELQEMTTLVQESNKRRESFKDMLKNKGTIGGFGILVMLMISRQLCGISCLKFYGVRIFSAANSVLDPEDSGILLTILHVIASFGAIFIVLKVGNRSLLMVSHVGMGVCLLFMGIYYYVLNRSPNMANDFILLPMSSFSIYIILFSIGSGPLPLVMLGELFPFEIKAIATSTCAAVNSITAFLVTLVFPSLHGKINIAAILWIFAECSVFSSILILLFVIETSKKSLQDIHKELADESEQDFEPNY